MHIHHPKIAKRWDKETPKGKLPKHVLKSKVRNHFKEATAQLGRAMKGKK